MSQEEFEELMHDFEAYQQEVNAKLDEIEQHTRLLLQQKCDEAYVILSKIRQIKHTGLKFKNLYFKTS